MESYGKDSSEISESLKKIIDEIKTAENGKTQEYTPLSKRLVNNHLQYRQSIPIEILRNTVTPLDYVGSIKKIGEKALIEACPEICLTCSSMRLTSKSEKDREGLGVEVISSMRCKAKNNKVATCPDNLSIVSPAIFVEPQKHSDRPETGDTGEHW